MIESLNSPHIARVKALIGSRGTKERKSSGHFVAEGLQCAREAIVATNGPRIETLYVTPSGRIKVEQIADLNSFNVIEVSDGSINIPHSEKCGYIEKIMKFATVYSEVGSKDAAHIIPPYKWIELMSAELSAGASYVIAEAREAGNVGIYRGSGEVREGLVQEILTKIPAEKILWEAPQKAQQLYFLELIGCNVNLGNIAPSEVIPLEAMRIGLRGDTFDLYLNK